MSVFDDWRQQLAALRKDRDHARRKLEEAFLLARRDPDAAEAFPQRAAELQAQLDQIAADDAATVLRLENADPRVMVNLMEGDTPILLLPLRVHTRFDGVDGQRQLLVRAYPDDISVQQHEQRLTPEERRWGEAMWAAPAAGAGDPAPTRLDLYRGLVATFGRARAAWVVRLTAEGVPRNGSDLDTAVRQPTVRSLPERLLFRIEFQGQVFEQLGATIPDSLALGFDPLAKDFGLRRGLGLAGAEDLDLPPELAWQADFEQALAVGMAVRVPLGQLGANGRIDRLIVLGVRLADDARQGAERWAELLDDHAHTDGFSLLPQGTPTNVGGDGERPAPDDGADLERLTGDGAWRDGGLETPFDAAPDGLRLAWACGLDPEVLRRAEGAGQRDGAEAIAAKRALWAGTLGYAAQQMLPPALEHVHGMPQPGERTILAARFFYTHFVAGRGPLPALRIGDQPYGVLPVSADMTAAVPRKRPAWRDDDFDGFCDALQAKLLQLLPVWRILADDVARAGENGEPKRLVEILGLQASSVEWRTERLIGREYLDVYSQWRLQADAPAAFAAFDKLLQKRWENFSAFFPGLFAQRPRVFDLSFFGATWKALATGATVDRLVSTPLTGALIDDRPLSETDGIADSYPNYITLLAGAGYEAARALTLGPDADGHEKVPLAFLALRHSLLHEYAYAAMRLLQAAAGVPWGALREREMHNVSFMVQPNCWDFTAERDLQLAGLGAVRRSPISIIEDPQSRRIAGFDWRTWLGDLDETRAALQLLQDRSTAALERLFAEHMDCAHYRIDAWLSGLVYARLMGQRLLPDAREWQPLLTANPINDEPRLRLSIDHAPLPEPARGLFLGAFGWVENIEPDAPGVPADDVPDDLLPAQGRPVTRDPDNAGFVHAPSLNHAVTAAVLRSASLSQPDRTALNVDLSSRRVRSTLDLYDGVRQGQRLPALLGYRFERRLREIDPTLQRFLPALRAAFPMPRSAPAPAEAGAAPKLAPGDVVNGLTVAREQRDGVAFAARLAAAGLGDAAVVATMQAIGAEIDAAFDACADLLIAEGVHQAAQGNFQRAAGVMSAAGEFEHVPDEFEVVAPPRSGHAVQHRLLLGFNSAAGAAPASPRARLVPELDAWIGTLLGDLAHTVARLRVTFSTADAEPLSVTEAIGPLGLAPVDLVHALCSGELEARLRHRVSVALAADQPALEIAEITIDKFPAPLAGGQQPVGRLLPLARTLVDLLAHARPATARDLVDPAVTRGAQALPDDGIDAAELRERVMGAGPGALRQELLAMIAALQAASQPDAADAAAIDSRLADAALFGAPEAVPPPAGHGPDDLARRRALAAHVAGSLQARLDAADAAFAVAPPADALAACRAAASTLLASQLPVMPRVHLQAHAALFDAGALAAPLPASRIDDWLLAAASVREPVRRLQRLRLLARLAGAAPATPTVQQWPTRLGRWIAEPLAAGVELPGEVVAQVLQGGAEALDAALPLVALVVDEWNELIPATRETTGIAMHYDSPAAEPPQALLLAVSTRSGDRDGLWSWDELLTAVRQTFELARLRAVEPDQLRQTVLDVLLPATLTAESPVPVTISTSYLSNISTTLATRNAQMLRDTGP